MNILCLHDTRFMKCEMCEICFNCFTCDCYFYFEKKEICQHIHYLCDDIRRNKPTIMKIIKKFDLHTTLEINNSMNKQYNSMCDENNEKMWIPA